MVTRRQLIQAIAALLLVLGASAWALWYLRHSEPVVIACTASTESHLLAEIMAQAIERGTGRDVVCQEVDSTSRCYADLHDGSAQIASVYAGSLLGEVFGLPPEPDPLRAAAEIAEHTIRESWLAIGHPFGCDDRYVLAMRRSQSSHLGIATIGDLTRHAEVRIGCIPEFKQRPDGWPGLSRLYRLHAAPVALAAGAVFPAIRDGRVDVIAASGTDPRILACDLQVLEDNRFYFPSYRALPLMRRDALERDPAIEMALTDLVGRVDDQSMRMMNAEVDLAGHPVEVVARTFVNHLAQAHP